MLNMLEFIIFVNFLLLFIYLFFFFQGSQRRSIQSMYWAPCYLIENTSSLESRNTFLYTSNPSCKLKLGKGGRMPFEVFYNIFVIDCFPLCDMY